MDHMRHGVHSRRTRRRRSSIVMSAVAVLGFTVSVVWAEPVFAQSGSRLCGLTWRDPRTQETLLELYEVGKRHHGLCALVKDRSR